MEKNISLIELSEGRIVPVDKPISWTSFDVVHKLRNSSKIKKVGHAGTLDPFASGLLLVCFARATKQVASLAQLDKEYIATLRLGVETDTHDLTGEVVSKSDVPAFAAEKLEELLGEFRGEIEQIPPMYSALKRGGTRLYKLARQGVKVERQPRRITILKLEMLHFGDDTLKIAVACSKGTYIRALARDIGRRMGCGAHLIELRRTRVGDYSIDDAWELDALVKSLISQRQAYDRF